MATDELTINIIRGMPDPDLSGLDEAIAFAEIAFGKKHHINPGQITDALEKSMKYGDIFVARKLGKIVGVISYQVHERGKGVLSVLLDDCKGRYAQELLCHLAVYLKEEIGKTDKEERDKSNLYFSLRFLCHNDCNLGQELRSLGQKAKGFFAPLQAIPLEDILSKFCESMPSRIGGQLTTAFPAVKFSRTASL